MVTFRAIFLSLVVRYSKKRNATPPGGTFPTQIHKNLLKKLRRCVVPHDVFCLFYSLSGSIIYLAITKDIEPSTDEYLAHVIIRII